MKLSDFSNDVGLNELREKMGAPLIRFVAPKGRPTLTPEEVEELATRGIEVPLKDVGVLNDGTFLYKGRRVVLYIRDVQQYRDQFDLPKFHLAMCETLLTMKDAGRFEARYTVATRNDGKFRIQKIVANRVASKTDEKLVVCQNCLHGLNYKMFNKLRPKVEKLPFLESFSISTFFEEFQTSPIWARPTYDDIHAPLNVYSPDFYEIAHGIKEKRGYRCESPDCKRDLSALPLRRYLHAHHIDADKSNNSARNIKLLCIHCHAKAFMHAHVRDMPDYREFCAHFGLT